VYASGRLCLPSGHLEDGESIPADTVGYAAAVITSVKRDLTFTLNGR